MNNTIDYGPEPFAVNISHVTRRNNNFRRALWTGENLQLTLMSIPVGGVIGLENHSDTDQFLRIEAGFGVLKMGECREEMDFARQIGAGDGIFVPAGTWHNIMNTGRCPLKIYSIYAPPHHPHGTVQRTKEIADREH